MAEIRNMNTSTMSKSGGATHGSFSRASRFRPLNFPLALLIALAFAGAARSQDSDPGGDSRAAITARAQAEKSKTAAPYVRNKAEVILDKVETIFLAEPGGWYPYFSSVYHGGGLTLGAGYRRFYGDNTSWNIQGLYSFKNYKLIEGGTDSRDHLKRRLSFGTKVGWRDATQVAYYGLGMRTSVDDITNFRFQQTYADGHVSFKPINWFVVKGNLAYEHWSLMEGAGSDPSIETKHTAKTAPGLGVDPDFIHSMVSAGIDWRTSPGYTRKGGLYKATLDDYRSSTSGINNFQKLTGEVIQYVPLLRETWVLAARGRVETTLNDNRVIPFYLLPKLGSGDDLRAFSTDRFRDRHSMVMNAEFRWLPAVGLDMALFYDAGKVTSRRNDLNFKQL